jgi:chromosome segregation ATPase
MRNRIGLIVLVLICLGLAIALVVGNKQAGDQQQQSTERIASLSNKWVEAEDKLEKQVNVNALYEKDMETQRKALTDLTNEVNRTSASLTQTTSELDKTKQSLNEAQQEVAKRDTKIAELETQNQALDKQALDLSNSITNLNLQIADTQKKLTASEGDKAFLETELKRLMGEKAELERQFNDLTVLRAQVAKIKEELNIARRIEWIRRGIFARNEQKGAQKLMQGFASLPPEPRTGTAPTKPAYDLNVEVSADGSVKVIPPLNTPPEATNSPPAK